MATDVPNRTRNRPIQLEFGEARNEKAAVKPLLSLSKLWWSWTGSNRRPHDCQSCALPAELQPQLFEAKQKLLIVSIFIFESKFCKPSIDRIYAAISENVSITQCNYRNVIFLNKVNTGFRFNYMQE